MLTKWKQSRTTFELSQHADNGATNKKKRPQEASSSSSGDIAVSFVKPLARQNPFYIERVKASKSSAKKRRKSNHGDASENVEDMEPILCITSPHRVALFGRSSAASGATLSESKSRNYVSRPGVGTSFDVAANPNSTLEGVAPCGVQYDPASNLLYAIRNGKELAIWTAASSSVLQGPDQQLDDSKGGGVSSNQSTKKRKEPQSSYTSFDKVISEHLAFPEGKKAVTLNPFYIHEQRTMIAVGASGCCEDGSVWIAICRDGSSFELLVEDGLAVVANEISRKTNRRKVTPAKSKKDKGDVANNWQLLDSRAISYQEGSGKPKDSFVIKVQSVMLSKDDGRVILRIHHIRVSLEGGKERSQVEKYVEHDILEASIREHISARLESSGESLCIVHKNDSEGWILSSVDTPYAYEESVGSLSSISLTRESQKNATLFSYGSLGQNVYALLSKEKCASSSSLLSTLRIVDTRRKVELLVHSWKEGGADGGDISSTDNVLTKMLHDKHCRAMITNEMDGSLVLVTSTSSGAIGVISSTISADTGTGLLLNGATSSTSTSLALALRAAAASAPSPFVHFVPMNTGKYRTGSGLVNDNHVDAAIDLACQELNGAAEAILGYIANLSEGRNEPISNGKTNKKVLAKTSVKPDHWRNAFFNGMTMIQKAKNPSDDVKAMNGLINGLKSEHKQIKKPKEQSQHYVTVAFTRTVMILMALHRKLKSLSADDSQVLEKIRQEAILVLLEVLQSNCLQSRAELDVKIPEGGNAFMQLFKVCPSVLLLNEDCPSSVGALDILNAILHHVQDLSERLLVILIRFVLRCVTTYDVTSYYSKGPSSHTVLKSPKGSKLARRLQQLCSGETDDQTKDLKRELETKLLSEALLEFTSKIVRYSTCNPSLLSKSMKDILTTAEVETVLVTLSKLLKLGDDTIGQKECSSHSSLYTGVIDWISSLTDAHTSNIIKVSDEGSLVVNRIAADVRSAVNQTAAANDLMELSDRIIDSFSEQKGKKLSAGIKTTKTTSIAAYTIERLVF